jgi:hypothetical protein
MSHILVLPASPTSDPLHLGVRGTLDVRARYATVPISRLQLELWSNYAAIVQTLMRGDGHVCDLRLWADITFHHEFPVKSVFRAPGYEGGEEWVLVREDAVTYESRLRTVAEQIHVGAANFVFSGLDHYDGGLHFETDFVSIEKLTNDLRSAS